MAATSSPLSKRFPKRARLTRSSQFHEVIKLGEKRTGHWLLVNEHHEENSSVARLGITVTKRFGKAHERNRFKRLVREAFRHLLPELPPGLSLNVKPTSNAGTASLHNIQEELAKLLNLPQFCV